MKVVVKGVEYNLIQIIVEHKSLFQKRETVAYVYDKNGKLFKFNINEIEKIQK